MGSHDRNTSKERKEININKKKDNKKQTWEDKGITR